MIERCSCLYSGHPGVDELLSVGVGVGVGYGLRGRGVTAAKELL